MKLSSRATLGETVGGRGASVGWEEARGTLWGDDDDDNDDDDNGDDDNDDDDHDDDHISYMAYDNHTLWSYIWWQYDDQMMNICEGCWSATTSGCNMVEGRKAAERKRHSTCEKYNFAKRKYN